MSNFSAGRLTNRLLFKDATKHSEIHRVMFCRDTRRTSLNNREWRKRKGKGPNICIDPGPISVNPAPIFPILPNAVRSTIDSTGYISKVVHCCFKCYTYLHTIHGIKLNWKIHGTMYDVYCTLHTAPGPAWTERKTTQRASQHQTENVNKHHHYRFQMTTVICIKILFRNIANIKL